MGFAKGNGQTRGLARTLRLLVLGAFVVSGAPAPTTAWDRTGHMVIDAIAWEHLSEPAREAAASLLARAPRESGLALPGFSPRELFLSAGYWPDIVRDEARPSRKERYDRPVWHYVNHFWRDGEPLPERGTVGDLVSRLEALEPSAGAVDLAWTLHLVGDVHQPLHSSARVTTREPNGDRGGNDFELADPEAPNLHAYWDGILRVARRKLHSESHGAWIDRLAADILKKHPRDSLASELAITKPSEWSLEGAAIARTRAYPETLARGGRPSREYEARALETAERQMALAGYRLADILNAALGSR